MEVCESGVQVEIFLPVRTMVIQIASTAFILFISLMVDMLWADQCYFNATDVYRYYGPMLFQHHGCIPILRTNVISTPRMYTDITDQCYFNATDVYRYYATKSLYDDVRGRDPVAQDPVAQDPVAQDRDPVAQDSVMGCQPSLLYLLARHGTRYPGEDDIGEMMQRLPQLKELIITSFEAGNSNLCSNDIDSLSKWHLRFDMTYASQLAPVGYQEMIHIAKRFQRRYPTLLKSVFSNSDVVLESTYTKRTIESAQGFTEGLYNRTDIQPNVLEKGKDKLLRFYDACAVFQKYEDIPLVEQNKFREGREYRHLLDDLRRRLGIPDRYITKDSVFLMYRMCIFDYVLYDDSPWCTVFSKENLQILEYAEDLKYFYSYSYGAPEPARDQACNLVKDFFQNLRDGSSPDYSDPRAILRFAHSQTFQTFLSSLGLFKNDIFPTASNMKQQDGRYWKTSQLGPGSANMVAVVFTCQNHSKVKIYVNEKAVIPPGCSSTTCELDKIFQDAMDFSKKCDFDEICNDNSGSENIHKSVILFVSIVSVFLYLQPM